MARYGSDRIRGHGIPEAIESILINGSRVEPKLAILKPLWRIRLAHRAIPPPHERRAQDPARCRGRRWHGGDIRCAARVGSRRGRTAAL